MIDETTALLCFGTQDSRRLESDASPTCNPRDLHKIAHSCLPVYLDSFIKELLVSH
jgi:hypothetical protein